MRVYVGNLIVDIYNFAVSITNSLFLSKRLIRITNYVLDNKNDMLSFFVCELGRTTSSSCPTSHPNRGDNTRFEPKTFGLLRLHLHDHCQLSYPKRTLPIISLSKRYFIILLQLFMHMIGLNLMQQS